MDGRISESMTSLLDLRLRETRTKRVLFEDTGRNTALEVAGLIDEIQLKERTL